MYALFFKMEFKQNLLFKVKAFKNLNKKMKNPGANL